MGRYIPQDRNNDIEFLKALRVLAKIDENLLASLASSVSLGGLTLEDVIKTKSRNQIEDMVKTYYLHGVEVGDVVTDYSGTDFVITSIEYCDDYGQKKIGNWTATASSFDGKNATIKSNQIGSSYRKTQKKFREQPNEKLLTVPTELCNKHYCFHGRADEASISVLEAMRILCRVDDDTRGHLFYEKPGQPVTLRQVIMAVNPYIVSILVDKINFYLIPHGAIVEIPNRSRAILVKSDDKLFTGDLLFDNGSSITISCGDAIKPTGQKISNIFRNS